MGNYNGKALKKNKSASQIKAQVWDYLLANFNEYALKEILEGCHMFCIEKEKKRILLDKISSRRPVRLKKSIVYSPQLFADLGLFYYKMEYHWGWKESHIK